MLVESNWLGLMNSLLMTTHSAADRGSKKQSLFVGHRVNIKAWLLGIPFPSDVLIEIFDSFEVRIALTKGYNF